MVNSKDVELSASVSAQDDSFEVTFEPDCSDNPKNWPIWYRTFIVATASFSTTCVLVLQLAFCATRLIRAEYYIRHHTPLESPESKNLSTSPTVQSPSSA